MFDDDQETPNTLNCAFEFDEDGKKRMLEFEVRHWMTQPRSRDQGAHRHQQHRQHLLRLEGLSGGGHLHVV